MKDQAAEATIAAVANKVTQAGAGTVFLGWLTLSDFALIVGLIATVAGFLVNLHFKRKDDRRRTAQHDKFMASMHLPPESEE